MGKFSYLEPLPPHRLFVASQEMAGAGLLRIETTKGVQQVTAFNADHAMLSEFDADAAIGFHK
jgi:hypothetical protein